MRGMNKTYMQLRWMNDTHAKDAEVKKKKKRVKFLNKMYVCEVPEWDE